LVEAVDLTDWFLILTFLPIDVNHVIVQHRSVEQCARTVGRNPRSAA
jgi:hypothetical protein